MNKAENIPCVSSHLATPFSLDLQTNKKTCSHSTIISLFGHPKDKKHFVGSFLPPFLRLATTILFRISFLPTNLTAIISCQINVPKLNVLNISHTCDKEGLAYDARVSGSEVTEFVLADTSVSVEDTVTSGAHCPTICELYSAVSIRRMCGIMLSICTLPVRPEKNSSSIILGLTERKAGKRRSNLQSLSGFCGWNSWI